MAAAWLMVSLTSSAMLVGLVQTAAAAPLMLFAIIGGTASDVWDRRTQILMAVSFCSIMALILSVLALTQAITPWSLLALTALISLGTAFYTPAWQASIIEIVPREELSSAASLTNLGYNTARSAGPVIGAELISIAGVAGAFFLNFVSYLAVLVSIAVWRPVRKPSHLPRQTIKRAISDGFRFIVLSPSISRLLLRSSLFGLAASALLALPPILALSFDGSARTFGVLLSGFGAGAIVGALAAAWLRDTIDNHLLLGVSSSVVALALLGLSLSTLLSMAAFFMIVAGSGWVLTISTINVSVQLSSPRWVVGRAIAASTTAFQFGVMLGAAIWGIAAEFHSAQAAFLLSFLCLLLAIFLCHFLPSHQPSEQDLQPTELHKEAELPKVNARSGPVVVIVEYDIPDTNAPDFMSAMQEVRRIRRRDGARRWSLRQDIDRPTVWIERFQSPTWGDYLHRINRRLSIDLIQFERIRDLCSREPVLQRAIERPVGSSPINADTAQQQTIPAPL